MAGKRSKSSERKQQIIEAATKLFSGYGYEKVTMSMLAKACRITEPALYRYFPSKKNIYNEVLMSLNRKVDISSLTDRVQVSIDIELILNNIARHILKRNVKNSELMRLLLFSSLEHQAMARQVFSIVRLPYIELLARELRRLREQELITDIDPVITARCFVGMFMDCAVSRNLWGKIQGEQFHLDEIIDNNVSIFVRGLKKCSIKI